MNLVTKWARWVVLAALFIIPFLSLYISNDLFFPFITGKNFGFRILVEIALGAYVVLALAEPKYRPQFSWTMVSYKALVVWMIIADAFAVNAHKAFWSNFERMDGWITLVHVFALFVIAGAVFSADNLWRKWWLTFLGGAGLVSIYGILQLFGTLAIHQGSTRIDASIGNSAYLAVYMIFACAIAVWQGIESKEKWLRYSLFVFAAVEAILVYETQTRGAVIGLLVGAVVALALWAWEERGRAGKRARQWAIGALVVIVVVAGGAWLARDTAFVQHDSTLQRVTSIGTSDLSTRFTIWSMALHGVEERPILGWGQEGFNYVFNTYFEPSMFGQEAWFDRAHNTFIDWTVAGGLPALAFFIAMLVTAVVSLYRRNTSRAERVLLIGALAAYAVQALVVFDNLFSYVPLAMVLAMAHSGSMKPWPPSVRKYLDRVPAITGDALATVVAPITIVATVLVLYFVNVPSIEAAHTIIGGLSAGSDVKAGIAQFQAAFDDHSFGDQEIAEQAVQYASAKVADTTVSDADKTAVLQFAVAQMQKQVTLIPNDARLWLELAIAYRTGGDMADARVASAHAQALSPKKQLIFIEQGSEALQAGDLQSAQQYFDAAYQLDTTKSDVAAYAATGHILAGDTKGADAILVAAFGTTTPDNDLIIYAYYTAKDYAPAIAIWKARTVANDTLQNDFNLAALYLQSGDKAAAIAEVNHAIQLNPQSAAEGQAFLTQIANTK